MWSLPFWIAKGNIALQKGQKELKYLSTFLHNQSVTELLNTHAVSPIALSFACRNI